MILSFISVFTPVSIHSEKSDFIIVLSGDTQRFFAGINLYKAQKSKK